jgi:hypothetical protein
LPAGLNLDNSLTAAIEHMTIGPASENTFELGLLRCGGFVESRGLGLGNTWSDAVPMTEDSPEKKRSVIVTDTRRR